MGDTPPSRSGHAMEGVRALAVGGKVENTGRRRAVEARTLKVLRPGAAVAGKREGPWE